MRSWRPTLASAKNTSEPLWKKGARMRPEMAAGRPPGRGEPPTLLRILDGARRFPRLVQVLAKECALQLPTNLRLPLLPLLAAGLLLIAD